MLAPIEIADGAILVTLYLALSLFLPLALFVGAAAIVATVLRIPLSAIPGLRVERGVAAPPLVAAARFIIVGALPLLIGSGITLAGLDRIAGGTSGDLGATLAGGVRALVTVLVGVQDAALRAWTGLAPADVIARMAETSGPEMLARFTRLVGAQIVTRLGLPADTETARAVFAGGVAIVSAAALGLSPLRALRSARASRAEFSERAWNVGTRETE